MAWGLKVAEIQKQYLTEKEIWESTHYFFYHGKNTSTYKYGFIKALLENVVTANEQFELSFDQLFYSFTKIYWNLVIHHQLWQSNNQKQPSAVQKEIEQFAYEQAIPKQWNFDQLPAEQQMSLIQKVKKQGKKYVIGAMYGDFNGEIYSFDLKKEHLQLHPKYYDFLQTYKRMLTNITNYQLALFSEKFNDTEKVHYLLTKVEFVTQRKSLKQFFMLLQTAGGTHCFYCQKQLKTNIHVDHFIPWSYIQSDPLWNFVLSCSNCNTKKNNKLATKRYLDYLMTRNEHWIQNGFYLTELETYSPAKLLALYEYSEKNGFLGGWEPKIEIQ